jgi:pimeloyl-ACP methyl ester carboxylesterase
VFFPGALVDPRAYVPNLAPLAAAGYRVVIVKAPYNIALLDRRAVGEVMDANDDITTWAVGGHSLGGVAASSAAGGSDARIAGLLLWASFPNGSIASREGIDVTSVSGSEDGLATPAKIEASAENLPPDTEFVVVEGATHAYFGDYGTQSGDGTATISRADAQDQIRAASLALLERIDLDR